MLNAEVLEEISTLVRSGVYDKDDLLTIFLEEMYEPGELDEDAVATAIDNAQQELESEKEQWPAVTDCDRLGWAFRAINGRGIIALHNAGYTQSDGYEDCCEALSRCEHKDDVMGYCFYHGQDLERAVRGGGLNLAFGPTNPEDEQTQGPHVGNIIREELERVGLKVVWDGTFATRIHIPSLVWQKR